VVYIVFEGSIEGSLMHGRGGEGNVDGWLLGLCIFYCWCRVESVVSSASPFTYFLDMMLGRDNDIVGKPDSYVEVQKLVSMSRRDTGAKQILFTHSLKILREPRSWWCIPEGKACTMAQKAGVNCQRVGVESGVE